MNVEDIKSMIGKQLGEVLVRKVEKEDINRFAEAVGDTNPLWVDEEYAKGSIYGKVVAPPLFINTFRPKGLQGVVISIAASFGRGTVVIATEFEFMNAVSPGDIIRAVGKITNVEKEEINGKERIVVTAEKEYTKQGGERIGIERNRVLLR